MRRLLLLLLLAPVLHGADDQLTAIRAILAPMRTAPIADARGATPALTDVKNKLRTWIESRVAVLKWRDGQWTSNPTVIQEQLDAELDHAGLFCHDPACEQKALGYLGRVAVELQFGFLVVRTSVGVQICGTDDSAYIYESTDHGWHRIWQTEQDNYEDKRYAPQRLIEVKISPTDWRPEADRSEHLIVTSGVMPWCTSVFQPIYYRAWQTKSTYSAPQLLLDGSEQADIASPIHVRANAKDFSIEYDVIADGAMRVPELRHYVLDGAQLRRADPVALTPQDFVSFWLRHPWNEVLAWTVPTARAALESWRKQYKGSNSEFTSPTRHCTSHPDLWQVNSNSGVDDSHLAGYYFLVRGRPPFRFTMVAASDHPWADCTEEDPAIDVGTELFDR